MRGAVGTRRLMVLAAWPSVKGTKAVVRVCTVTEGVDRDRSTHGMEDVGGLEVQEHGAA
jgi:hypothetical protein